MKVSGTWTGSAIILFHLYIWKYTYLTMLLVSGYSKVIQLCVHLYLFFLDSFLF